MKNSKKPYYGKKTKRKVVEDYFNTSASMDELAKLHGILGSNTVADWLRKSSNLRINRNKDLMVILKSHSPIVEKNYRKKRQKTISTFL